MVFKSPVLFLIFFYNIFMNFIPHPKKKVENTGFAAFAPCSLTMHDKKKKKKKIFATGLPPCQLHNLMPLGLLKKI